MIEIARVKAAVARHGERFLQRVFTAQELDYCGERAESLAARFAAKEAMAKALGSGVWRDGINWTDLEVSRDPESGAPSVLLHGPARERAERLGLRHWSLSLSHDRERAIAFVVATRT
jgi:holo-[acyl-carrier protein] synthase